MHTVTAKIPETMYSRLLNLVQETDRDKSYYIRMALEEFLEEKEDYLIAVARMAKKGPRISLEDLEKELGLEN